jgi:hypothetical protein
VDTSDPLFRNDVNNPPTAVGGIQRYKLGLFRKYLNDPPTTVDGIFTAKPVRE